MKRIIALVLVFLLILVSCTPISNKHEDSQHTESSVTTEVVNPTTPPSDDNTQEDPAPDQNQPEHTHDYQSVTTPPTCSSDGYTTHLCSVCGDSYISDIVETAGHSITGVVSQPNCDSEGYTI